MGGKRKREEKKKSGVFQNSVASFTNARGVRPHWKRKSSFHKLLSSNLTVKQESKLEQALKQPVELDLIKNNK